MRHASKSSKTILVFLSVRFHNMKWFFTINSRIFCWFFEGLFLTKVIFIKCQIYNLITISAEILSFFEGSSGETSVFHFWHWRCDHREFWQIILRHLKLVIKLKLISWSLQFLTSYSGRSRILEGGGGAIIGKKRILRCIRIRMNLFFVRFC